MRGYGGYCPCAHCKAVLSASAEELHGRQLLAVCCWAGGKAMQASTHILHLTQLCSLCGQTSQMCFAWLSVWCLLLHEMSAGAGGGAAGVDDSSRRAAEEALCLLAVLESVLSHLGAVEQDVAQQLSSDLVNMLNKQRYLQLIAVSCQLLCTLAALYQPAAEHVKILGNRVYSIASPLLTSGPQSSTPNNSVAQAAAPRYDSNTLCCRRVQLCNRWSCMLQGTQHAACFGRLGLRGMCAYPFTVAGWVRCPGQQG